MAAIGHNLSLRKRLNGIDVLEYLVARNEGGAVFSGLIDTELLLKTERGIFLTSVNTEKAPINFLHVANRLGDGGTPLVFAT